MPEVWAIDGVEVPAAVARALPYVDNGGAEGVVEPASMQVLALATPSTSVRVLPGGALVRNRYAGGSLQSYAALEQVQQTVPVVATGSSGGRSDLVVLRVSDPEFASGDAGATFEIIQGVPSNADHRYAWTLGFPAIALARVDIPASTATVTNDMITDLRRVARPRRETLMLVANPVDGRRLSGTSFMAWPVQSSPWDTVDIPDWATRFRCIATYTAVRTKADTYGYLRVAVGENAELVAEGSFNTTNAAASEVLNTFQAANSMTIPADMRGTTQPIRLQGRLAASGIPSSAGPWSTSDTRVVVQFEFAEQA